MKGKELKTKKIEIELIDGVHECVFDMNTLAEIEDIYGDIQTGLNQFESKPIGALRTFIYALLKKENEKITISDAGSLIPLDKIENVVKSISDALSEAMPSNEVIEEEEEKNTNPNE